MLKSEFQAMLVLKSGGPKSYILKSGGAMAPPAPLVPPPMISKLVIRIKEEMKDICSISHDSILRDHIEAVKHFHWDTVFLELVRKLPTLMSLLSHLLPRPMERKPLLCLLASQLLKARNQHMGLVQRAISMMLYGSGTSWQTGECITF